MKVKFALAAAALVLAHAPVQARPVSCVIKSGPVESFQGPCNFEPDGRDGSFTLSSLRGRNLTGDVSMITVTVVAPGLADVRGLTGAGVNSRWGEARRSRVDGACWIGSDFEICAY